MPQCRAVSNKEPAIYNGKVLRGTLNAFVVALDQKTGQEVWKQFVNAVRRGKDNMPRWGDLLRPEGIDALRAYVMAGEPRQPRRAARVPGPIYSTVPIGPAGPTGMVRNGWLAV